CKAIGLEELLEDTRFLTNELRVEHRDELIRLIEEVSTNLEADELDKTVKSAGVPGSKVNTLADVVSSPFTAEREILQPLEDDASTFAVKFPVTFGRTPVQGYRSSPQLNEHQAE